MARDDTPTPLRRLMMQSIMWLILGGTVGVAAVVSHYKRQSLVPPLSEPQQIEGIRVKLPTGWGDPDGESDERTLVRVQPQFGDTLVIAVTDQPRSNPVVVEAESRSTRVKEIDLGGEPANLIIIRHPLPGGHNVLELNVSRNVPRNRRVTLRLVVPGARTTAELAPEIALIQRIAASVEVDVNY